MVVAQPRDNTAVAQPVWEPGAQMVVVLRVEKAAWEDSLDRLDNIPPEPRVANNLSNRVAEFAE